MQKIKYSVILSIGLLIFSTFFSCTNTRKAMNQSREEQGLLKKITTRPTAGNMKRTYNRNPKKILCATAIGVSILGAGAAAYAFSNIPSNPSYVPPSNSTNLTTTSLSEFNITTIEVFNSTGSHSNASTPTGSTVPYDIYAPSSTTVPNETTYDASITELLPTENIMGTLKTDSNGLNNVDKNSSVTTKKSLIINDIYQSIIDIKLNNFSTSNIHYWINQGLSINAQDPVGTSLLMYAVDKDNYESVKYIVDNGGNLNLQDHKGNTALMYVRLDSTNSKKIFDYLLENRADPCIKNKDGKGLKDIPNIEKYTSEKLLKKLKKCS